MQILRRYIVRECLIYLGTALLICVTVLFTLRLLKFADLIINKGVATSQILMVFVAIVPTFMEIAIPLAVLFGVMLAFSRLSGDSEIIVARASGISVAELLRPAIYVGLACSLVALMLSLYVRPWGFRQLSLSLFDIARTRSTAGLNDGVFNELGGITLYAQQIDDASGQISRVLIDDRRNEDSRQIITAEGGRILSNAADRSIIFDLRNGFIHSGDGRSYSVTQFNSNNLVMSTDEVFNPDAQLTTIRPREMQFRELQEHIDHSRIQSAASVAAKLLEQQSADPPSPTKKHSKDPTRELIKGQLEMYQRFAIPISSTVLALIAVPLGIHSPRTHRTWGAGLSLGFGLLVFIGYFGLLTIGNALAEKQALSPLLAAWLPNLCGAAIAWILVRNFASERWGTALDSFEKILAKTKISSLFRRTEQ